MEQIDHKKNAARFDYEFMGKSEEDIAQRYSYPLTAVKQEIQVAGWTRKLDPNFLPDTEDIEKFSEELEVASKQRLSIISLFRQLDQQPILAQIENAALEQILYMINTLDHSSRNAAKDITALVNAVAKLKEQSPINIAEQLKTQSENAEGGVTVQILNNIT